MIEPPFVYTGSKYKLLEQLLPQFDYSKKYFVDLFTGGGSVYSNILDKYEVIVVNDIIKDLIGIHQSLMNSDEIISLTKSICPDKNDQEAFLSLRQSYNDNKEPHKLWALMLSSTNNMIRFNMKFNYNQTFGKRSWNYNTEKKTIDYVNHIRPFKDKVKYVSKSFSDIKIIPNSMVYADPPYSFSKLENGDLANKQISEAGYNAFWKKEDDINLYDYLKQIDKIGSSFMISGVLEHDGKICWILDKLIQDGFKWIEIKQNYNKVSRKGDKITKEIIIMNY